MTIVSVYWSLLEQSSWGGYVKYSNKAVLHILCCGRSHVKGHDYMLCKLRQYTIIIQ